MLTIRLLLCINSGDIKVMKKLPNGQVIPAPRKFRVNRNMHTPSGPADLRKLQGAANPTGRITVSVGGCPFGGRTLKQELRCIKNHKTNPGKLHIGSKRTTAEGKAITPCCSQNKGGPGRGIYREIRICILN